MDKQEQQAIALSQQVVISPIDIIPKLQEKLDAERANRKREAVAWWISKSLHEEVLKSITREQAEKVLMPVLKPFETHKDFKIRKECFALENTLIEEFSL